MSRRTKGLYILGLIAALLAGARLIVMNARAASTDANATTHVRVLLVDSGGNAVNAARMGGSSTLLTVVKNTWTALGTSDSEVLWITGTSAADSKTATITVWGSTDAGTTYRVLPRADTLAPAKSVSLSTGTDVIGTGTRCDGVAVMPFGATSIYIQETTSSATITYTVSGK